MIDGAFKVALDSLTSCPMYVSECLYKLIQMIDDEGNFWTSDNEVLEGPDGAVI